MRHKVGGRKLGIPTGHRLSLYRNQVTDLLRHEKIVTTEAKAKEVRKLAEHVITLGKAGTLHARRLALSQVWGTEILDKTFKELKERYATRPGGYTRITKLGPRPGDAASMVILELV